MVTRTDIEKDLTKALKERATLDTEVLRGLKTRIQNEQIAKGTELSEQDMLALLRSEVKRRKEAVETYTTGGRPELAQKEQDEIQIIARYLPPEVPEADIRAKVEEIVSSGTYTMKDMGKVVAAVKTAYQGADGAMVAAIVKEKLTSM